MANSNTGGSNADERDADITNESRFDDLVEEIDGDRSDSDADPEGGGDDAPPVDLPEEDDQTETDDHHETDDQPEAAPAFMQESRQRTAPSGSHSTAASLSLRRKVQIALLVFFFLLLIVSLLWEFVG